MSTDLLADQLTTLTAAAAGQHPRVFASYGEGTDADVAFDDAAAAAGNAHGFTGAHPSLASADADAIIEVPGGALPGPAAALKVAADIASGDLEPGAVYAYPVAVPSGFTRRRARVTLSDVELVAPSEPGRVAHLDAALREAILTGLAEAGTPLLDGEVLESVDIVRSRSRFKPLVEVFRTKSTSTHVLFDPATQRIVATGFANAGAARREAVALAKLGPLSAAGSDPELGVLEVLKVTGREDGQPLMRIVRSRIKAQIVVKVVLISEKNPQRTRRAGWVFAGVDPTSPVQDVEPDADVQDGTGEDGED